MTDSIDSSRSTLIQDFKAVVEDGEKLLRALAATGAEKGGSLRASAEENLAAARERLKELQADAMERSRAAAKATDEYVHENPWQSMGAVALVAALVGFILGAILMDRR